VVAAGFEVFDVGKDIPPQQFVAKAREVDAHMVGASALLTTSMPMQAEIVKGIVGAGLRNKIKLMFGGAAVTQEWTTSSSSLRFDCPEVLPLRSMAFGYLPRQADP